MIDWILITNMNNVSYVCHTGMALEYWQHGSNYRWLGGNRAGSSRIIPDGISY